MKIKDTSAQDIQVITTTHKSKRFTFIAIGTLLAAALIWQVAPSAKRWGQAEKSVSIDRVRIATITRGDFTRDISVLGRVVAAARGVCYSNDLIIKSVQLYCLYT